MVQHIHKTLKSHGFAVNTYYICISNSIIDGKKYTIAWYVDDNKVSYVDEELSTRINETIAKTLVNSP